MNNFFSLKYFRELSLLFILLSLVTVLSYPLTSKMTLNYFNVWALLIAISIWLISCMIDTEKYFNFLNMIVVTWFGYGVFWFCFEIMFKLK